MRTAYCCVEIGSMLCVSNVRIFSEFPPSRLHNSPYYALLFQVDDRDFARAHRRAVQEYRKFYPGLARAFPLA